jgi:SWI/SNF-related matrix-associated actin-dependent regulator of chromatin subfamily A member 5
MVCITVVGNRFDWFFKSRTPDELRRRGATLLLCIMKDKDLYEEKPKPKGKVRPIRPE